MLTKREKISKARKRLFLKVTGEKGQGYPAFIFGEQRSGTNMLINTLNNSPETECYNETDDEAFANCEIKPQSVISALVERSFAKAVVFKSICDSQNARKLLDTHLNAKGIWIFRNYNDVINSNLKAFKQHYDYLYYVLYEPERASWRAENITKKNLELIRHYYHKQISDASARALIWYLRNYQYFQQNLENESTVLLLNYESLVSNPADEFRRVFGFLNVRYDASFTNDIFSASVKKQSSPEIEPDIEKLCHSLFTELQSVATGLSSVATAARTK